MVTLLPKSTATTTAMYSIQNQVLFSNTPVALTVPEILENIFSYLSLHKRSYIASLVCRQWHAISRRLGVVGPTHRLVWSVNLNEQQHRNLLQHLPFTRILTLSLDDPQPTYDSSQLTQLLECLKDFKERNQVIRLYEIEISGSLFFGSHILPLLSLLPSISILRLYKTGLRTWTILQRLFEKCPNLEELHLRSGEDTPFPWLFDEATQGTPQNFYVLGRLRVLVVHDLILHPRCLETIINACPNLRELKVIEARPISSHPLHAYNKSAFFSYLKTACPHLKRLHFSVQRQYYTRDEIETLFDQELSGLREWSFSDHEFQISHVWVDSPLLNRFQSWTPDIQESHAERYRNRIPWSNPDPQPGPTVRGNNVTWLELTGSTPNRLGKNNSAKILHQFLCQSPHLQHLIAPNSAIFVEDLDVNGLVTSSFFRVKSPWSIFTSLKERMRPSKLFYSDFPCTPVSSSSPTATTSSESSESLQIWACRDLRTLHVGFTLHYGTTLRQAGCLVLFGYLSRVCPQLQDMSIRVINMDIKNQKGLRLLTRLQNLERLIIDCDRISASFGLKDLAWIRRLSKPSITKQLSPRRLRDRLQGMIDSNRIVGPNPEQSSKRSTTFIPRVQQRPKPKVDYGQDVIDMSDVGLDQDMAAWKSERQYEKECGVPHWPLLEAFQIRYRSAPLWNDENKPDFKSLRHDVRIDVVCVPTSDQ